MDHGDHVMLAGEGAETLGRAQGLESAGQAYFETVERRDQLNRLRGAGNNSAFDSEVKYGTVGAVARDGAGHVAAATSTGGLTGKRPGRIGDSPVIGAGTYADDRSGAVSATGSGEHYIRTGAAAAICSRIRYLDESGLQAADAVQKEVFALGGRGGVIVVTETGEGVWSFNTSGMYRGRLSEGGTPYVAIYDDE